MNFFEMDLDGSKLVGEQFEYALSAETANELGDSTRVTLGVRPEDVELVSNGSDEHDFETVVDVVEPMGNENNVYLRFADADESKTMEERQTFVATLSGMRSIEEGQEVVARIPEDAIHLFDTETGAALRNRRLDQEATLPNR